MPRQNRVTPFGDIVAQETRGLFTGNRGCLHNSMGKIEWFYQGKRWIICDLKFKGPRHQIMAPGYYTHLFFLDEATALSAGHRPCAQCRRDSFEEFRKFWAEGNPTWAGTVLPAASTIDTFLHPERINLGNQKVTYAENLDKLPAGAMIIFTEGHPYLVLKYGLLRWSPGGYEQYLERPKNITVRVLTPRSTIRAIAAGYVPVLHSSAARYRM